MPQMPDQITGALARLDDPWGVTWRVANRIKRISARRTLRFLKGYLRPRGYDRPVFVIGAPRSGTTMLFHLLRESSELGALPFEGHDAWRKFHHPRKTGWDSDAVGAGQVRFGERRFLSGYFESYFHARRFVEKTPDNSLRVPYLLELFPDALFVVIKRNPCDVINSLINGWRHPKGRYRAYYVPESLDIPAYPHRHRWCFTLIEGWRKYRSSTIPEIAFAQWEQFVTTLEQVRTLVPPDRWTDVYFEDMLDHPQDWAEYIYQRIGIHDEPSLRTKLGQLMADPINQLSPPGKDKWRRDNPTEVAVLLPRIAAVARETGYDVDAVTGQCRPSRKPLSDRGADGVSAIGENESAATGAMR